MNVERELTKEELEAQIRHKERRLESDFGTTTSEVRERLGFHVRVTLPVAVTVLTGAGLLARGVAMRRVRMRQADDPRRALLTLARASMRLPGRSLLFGALLFGVGRVLGRRASEREYFVEGGM